MCWTVLASVRWCWITRRGTSVLSVPDGLEFVFLPSYSPERPKPVRCWFRAKKLQPAERLWALCDEPVVNRCLPSLAALEAVLSVRCVALMGDAGRVRAFTRFGWWPINC